MRPGAGQIVVIVETGGDPGENYRSNSDVGWMAQICFAEVASAQAAIVALNGQIVRL